MQNPHLDYGPRYLGAAVLSAGIIVLTTISWLRWRRGGRKGILIALYGYNIILMALFILGLISDDGFGWAFLPLLLCTAPWSFLLPHNPAAYKSPRGLVCQRPYRQFRFVCGFMRRNQQRSTLLRGCKSSLREPSENSKPARIIQTSQPSPLHFPSWTSQRSA